MKNFPFKYEQLEYQGTGILRVPCIDFRTVWEAKNQFEVELVARRLEGKL